VTPADDES